MADDLLRDLFTSLQPANVSEEVPSREEAVELLGNTRKRLIVELEAILRMVNHVPEVNHARLPVARALDALRG